MPVLFGGLSGLALGIALIRLGSTYFSLRENQEYLQDFMDNASDLIQSVAPDGTILYTNRAWRKTLGYKKTELINKNIFDIIADEDRQHCMTEMSSVLLGNTIRVKFGLRAKNGEIVFVDGWVNCRMERGKPISTRGILRNITASRQVEEAQRLASSVFEYANDGIFVASHEGYILTINRAFTNITGFTSDDLQEKQTNIFLCQEQDPQSLTDELNHSIKNGENWEGELVAKKKSGENFPSMLKLSSVLNDQGNTINFVGLLTDITAQKKTEEHLQHLAMHDIPTNLPNRILFIDRLRRAIHLAEHSGKLAAVLFMDLDGFKAINDNYGHTIGDVFMRIIARRLKSCISEKDTVARLGGDEFAILLEGIEDKCDAIATAESVLKQISKPVVICKNKMQTTASIGISIYPELSSEQELLNCADQAMYKAKNSGKNTYNVYIPKTKTTEIV